MTTLQSYHYPVQYAHLLDETQDHELHILHEDGLYRHLRFQKPGTSMWHWDLITWPGSLAIRGDIGEGFIFTRERDMLTWFDHGQPDGHINPGYWAEKLDRGSRSAREFSWGKWMAWLREDQKTGLTKLLLEAAEDVGTVEEAVSVLDDWNISWDYEDTESWKDYEYHFILALHAILWGAKKYHAAKRGA